MSDAQPRNIARIPMGDEHIVSAEAMEHVLGTGELQKLTVPQRVQYYLKVCDTIGINPMTRPFRFMNFQGAVVMYATRDCTDQLREKRKISIEIKEKRLEGELFMVTAHASDPTGRQDEDVGAVSLGPTLRGEARANAIMKAITKSKRRVTLSICGLGYLDEDEVATLPGAVTYEHDAPAPERPEVRTPTPRPSGWAPLNPDGGVPMDQPAQPRRPTAAEWLDAFEIACGDAQSAEAADKLITSDESLKMRDFLTGAAKARYDSIITTVMQTWFPPAGDGPPAEGEAAP